MDTPTPTSALTPNRELLLATLNHIKANPHDWDQNAWRCGTTACYAGHAAILNGVKWALETDPFGTDAGFPAMPEYAIRVAFGKDYRPTGSQREIEFEDVTYVRDDGTLVFENVRSYAETALGLNHTQAGELFAGDNTLVRLEGMVRDLMSDNPPYHL